MTRPPPPLPGRGPRTVRSVRPPGPPPTSGVAIGALVCGILGLTALPVVAGLPAAGLGAAALVSMRRQAGALGGRGLALAGLVLGLVGGVVPTAVILAVVGRREDAGVASALAAVVLAYGVAVLGLAGYGLAGTGPGQERAAVAAAGATMGGLVILAVSVVAVVCVGLLFWLGARELIDQTITAIGEAFVDAVTG